MTDQKDMWIREWQYDQSTHKWVEMLSLYDDGNWVDSVPGEEFIPIHYYVKEHVKSYDDFMSADDVAPIPDYSHLYEIAEDDSIDSPVNRLVCEE